VTQASPVRALGLLGLENLVERGETRALTTLANGVLTGKASIAKLGLQPRGTIDSLDALVS
jgi:hypothetical protein